MSKYQMENKKAFQLSDLQEVRNWQKIQGCIVHCLRTGPNKNGGAYQAIVGVCVLHTQRQDLPLSCRELNFPETCHHSK